MLHAVIMAGGSGTRFWPLSRRRLPKQFLTLQGERSLIQSTFDRCQPEIPAERFWVVTNASMVGTTAEHLPEIPPAQLLPEPCARNTAPCVGLAAHLLVAQNPDAIMLVMPADHVIAPTDVFRAAVQRAAAIVEEHPEQLVLFGVPPTYPATGFGYIERGSELTNNATSGAFNVAAFHEKPELARAEEYLQQGRFYWNCGIFVWKATTILAELAKHQPQLTDCLQQIPPDVASAEFANKLQQQFPLMPSISIDHAVLEHAERISVIEAPFQWDDVGSWEALSRLQPPDAAGNTIVGKACVVESRDCIVRSAGEHVVSLLGMEHCIVVQTPEATLVADRRDENAIRRLVAALEAQGYDHLL